MPIFQVDPQQQNNNALAVGQDQPRTDQTQNQPPAQQIATPPQPTATPPTIDQQISSMPNADKLSVPENYEYHALSGLSQSWLGSTLNWFNNTPFGKVLGYANVPAEALNKTIGLGIQMVNGQVNPDDLKTAWYAGSMWSDFANLPKIVVDPNTKQASLQIPHDLSGTGALGQAQAKIKQLVATGMSENDALNQVRSEYYSSLGALAIRAQNQNMIEHMALDPVILASMWIKPVAITQKIAEMVREGTVLGTSVEEAAKAASEANAVLETAKLTGDATKIADATRQATEATQLAADFASGKVKPITTIQKMAYWLTGGDPFNPSPMEKASKIPVIGILAKPWVMTPVSKAMEGAVEVTDHIGATWLTDAAMSENPARTLEELSGQAERGALGNRYGHMNLTPVGRVTTANLSGVHEVVKVLADDYLLPETVQNRGLLATLKEGLQMNEPAILEQAVKDPTTLANKIVNNPILQAALKEGSLKVEDTTPQALTSMATSLKGIAYNDEQFIAKAGKEIQEVTSRNIATMFGIKPENGLWNRFTSAMSAAQNMAFLRFNPAFYVKKALTDEFTMLARGTFGLTHPDVMDAMEKAVFGVAPVRYAEGMTIGGEEAANVVQKMARSDLKGLPESLANVFRGVKVGKFNASTWAHDFTKQASKMATYQGQIRYLHTMAEWTKASEFFQPESLDRLEQLVPGITKTLDGLGPAAGASDSKLMASLGGNLHMNTKAILDAISTKMGIKAEDAIGAEGIQYFVDNLPDAIAKGKTKQFAFKMQNIMQDHMDTMWQNSVDSWRQEIAVDVQARGPTALYDAASQAQDLYHSAEVGHYQSTGPVAEAARAAIKRKDFAAANSLWETSNTSSMKYFARTTDRVKAVLDGAKDGWNELYSAGKISEPFPEKLGGMFDTWRKNWTDFFDWRNTESRDFFEALSSKKPSVYKNFDELRAATSAKYDEVVASEKTIWENMDRTIADGIRDPQMRQTFLNGRSALNAARTARREATIGFYRDELPNTAPKDRPAAYNAQSKGQIDAIQGEKQLEELHKAALQGDPNAQAQINTIGEQARQQQILADTRKSLTAQGLNPDLATQGTIKDAAGNVMAEPGTPAAREAPPIKPVTSDAHFIADTSKMIPPMRKLDLMMDEASNGKAVAFINGVVDAAKEQAAKSPALIENLPQDLKDEVMRFVDELKSNNAPIRYGMTKYGEFARDSSLLNYNRRINFDSYVHNVFPYAFFTTHSAANWVIHSIDRPAMLQTYLRMQEFLNTTGLVQPGMPSRLAGKVRIPLPFVPSFMGDQFFDPLKLGLPLEAIASPFTSWMQNNQTAAGRAQRLLMTQLQSNQITQQQYDDATNNKSGPEWDQAMTQAVQNDESLNNDAFTFASTVSSPYAPMMWAYNIASGHPENIGNFSPLDSIFKNAATAMGVPDWNNSSWNLEARLRKTLGLPAFDKWDGYRIDREISNMATEGKYTMDQIQRAMIMSGQLENNKITLDQAKTDPSWGLYQEATKRANQEAGGTPSGLVMDTLGIPISAYPTGENEQRNLSTGFSAAYDAYKNTGNNKPLNDYFNQHPEAEARLALFKTPDDRLKQFLIDNTWAKYNSMPKVNQGEMSAALGPTFQNAFLNKSTRSYDSITLPQLQVWFKVMGGNPPGTLSADQSLLADLYNPKLTSPETAWRAQSFYDQRNQNFPDYYTQQDDYYKLPVGAQRNAFLAKNPDLKQYWDWRSDFMLKNPDLVQYLTDDPKAIAKAQTVTRTPTAQGTVPNAEEIQAQISPSMRNLLSDYASNGTELPATATQSLEILATRNGLTIQQLYGMLGIP